MAHFLNTIALSDIESIQIYQKKLRNNKAGLQQVLANTGGDIVMTGAIFLKTMKPCCHLKVDGDVLCQPEYTTWAISWNTPKDFGVRVVPTHDFSNYMACVKCLVDGKKVEMDYQPDMAYACNRVFIGVKDGRFAYLATENNYTPEEVQDVVYDDGWEWAVMMDGGGSACLWCSDGTGFAGDGRYLPFWIVVTLKKSTIKCPYKEPSSLPSLCR